MEKEVRAQIGQLEGLQPALLQAIEAVSSAIEQRDPYSIGHQRRVANLAVAIAREIGLPLRQLDGIYIGGIVHDIGELAIPLEILAHPGKLTDLQLGIIRSHPEIGHAIFKEVSFPWPIADMVFQHHERLDGSGYPRGIKGPDILPEAKILAVADVVEAMVSPRPHRPAIGLDAALEEISRGRRTCYDPAAVDACVQLAQGQGFRLG